jgi:phage gp29-like protein
MSGTLPTGLGDDIASIDRDTLTAVGGFVLPTRDEILIRRGGITALGIYQDLARDGHAGSVLRKRRQAVVARPWTVEPASPSRLDKQAAALIDAAVKRIRFDRACQGLLGSVLTGIAVAEVIWEVAPLTLPGVGQRDWIVPRDIRVRNPRRFVIGRDGALRLRTRENPAQGETLPERKFILVRYWAEENEDPYGRGLGHDLWWPVYFKRNGVALWNALIEKFGQPFVYAEYVPGTPKGDRDDLLVAIQNIARGAGLVVPQGSLVKFLEAGAGGGKSGDLHQAMVSTMNSEISKIVLGETLTTEMGSVGSRAASETHDGVRDELADADADLLSAELGDTLLRWIVELNLPGAGVPALWRKHEEEPDLQARANLDKTLFDLGFEPKDDYVAETYGPGYQRKVKMAPPPMLPPAMDPNAPGGPPPPEFAEGDDAPGQIAERLAQDAAGAQAAMVTAIQAEVANATSFADLEDRLLRLSSVMPIQRLVTAMAPSFALAHLAGRSDVRDEGA